MKPRYVLLVLTVLAFASFGMGYANAATSTQEFVRKAAIANEFEIESSHLALERSRNRDVRAFAERMIEDHLTTGDRLELAIRDSRQRLRLPRALDNTHMNKLRQLERVSNRNFDQMYLQMQRDAHREAVQLFTDYRRNGADPALREFARETLPHLRDHREHVAQLGDMRSARMNY